MSHYTMLSTYGNCTRLLKLISSWKSVVLTNKVGKNCRYFVGVSNKTIIPIALRWLYPIRTRGIIVKYYIESERAKSYDVTIYNNKTRSFTDLHYLFVRVSQKEIWFPLWIFFFATYSSTRCIKIMYFLDHRHCLFLDLLASYHFLLVGCHHLNIHLVQSLDIFK